MEVILLSDDVICNRRLLTPVVRKFLSLFLLTRARANWITAEKRIFQSHRNGNYTGQMEEGKLKLLDKNQ